MRARSKLLPVLIFAFIAVAGSLNQAMAQKNNASDWNVPPPLPPSNGTKGSNAPQGATIKPVVLSISDIPATTVPTTPPVQVPVLAAISATPPPVNQPDQPIASDDGGLPGIPLPSAPGAPPLPHRTFQDAPSPSIVDVPAPAMPEMPAFPPEPTSSGQQSNVKRPIPAMPEVVSQSSPSIHSDAAVTTWSTPEIPENINFKLVMPVGKKGFSYGKDARKVKHQKN